MHSLQMIHQKQFIHLLKRYSVQTNLSFVRYARPFKKKWVCFRTNIDKTIFFKNKICIMNHYQILSTDRSMKDFHFAPVIIPRISKKKAFIGSINFHQKIQYFL